jgi:hypothetical protein
VPDRTARELFELWVGAIASNDFDRMRDLLTPDFVEDFPQSGERLRGYEALRRMLEGYPGGLTQVEPEELDLRMVHDERWVITPATPSCRWRERGRIPPSSAAAIPTAPSGT